MSRLSTMSQAAIAALFKPDSKETLITLLTIYDPNNENNVLVRLADNYLQRIETLTSLDLSDLPTTGDEDVIYGVVSNNLSYIFMPMQITLPSEEQNTAPRASIVLNDVTRYVVPIIRTISGPPKIKLELVLTSSPDIVEISFDKLYMSSITYNADQVTAELSMIDFATEPFPAYQFTPAHFPGLF